MSAAGRGSAVIHIGTPVDLVGFLIELLDPDLPQHLYGWRLAYPHGSVTAPRAAGPVQWRGNDGNGGNRGDERDR